ncbi:MAG: glutamine synthetase adenylyltransferase [Planctomycetaceae bacterium]
MSLLKETSASRSRRASSLPEPFPDEMIRALVALGVPDAPAVCRRLEKLSSCGSDSGLFQQCCQRFIAALDETPIPETAVAHFERLLEGTERPAEWCRYLLDHPRAMEILVKLFVGSQHLTDTLVRQPELLWELTQQRRLADLKTRDDYLDGARTAVREDAPAFGEWNALRRYQRRELLRIGAADTFSLFDLRSTTSQLSLLADAMIAACLELAADALGSSADDLAILAMGKLGGSELNYSSDIDLVLLAPEPSDRSLSLAQRLVKSLDEKTEEGFLYRVDLRLRPWGSAGPLVVSPGAYLSYLASQASTWERQSLLKVRCVAGNWRIGDEFLKSVEPYVYQPEDVQTLRSGVRQAKQRIEAELRRRGRGWGDVKSGTGSIRDIEFIVQSLQLQHGAAIPTIRSAHTLDGLVRLADFDCLRADEYRQLTDGYVFLRTVEHALQLMHHQQRHTLPSDRRELTYLARRIDYPDAETFIARYEQHVATIRVIYSRYLEEDPARRSTVPALPSAASVPAVPRYETYFSSVERRRHQQLLLETSAAKPVRVSAERAEDNWRVTVVGDDRPGDLSMTCGLFFVYGFDILEGFVSTAVRASVGAAADQSAVELVATAAPLRHVFVNVFTVRPPYASDAQEVWINYERDLNKLFVMARTHQDGAAQGVLAKRVAAALGDQSPTPQKLTPLQIAFDNDASSATTTIRLRAEDSLGFLYEMTNALALCGVDVKTMVIQTDGQIVQDTLLVTDAQHGGKITSPARLQELRAALVLIKHFTHLLPTTPNPEAALLHFRSFLAKLIQQPDWVEELASLDRPEVLEALARLLGVSDFLWEELLRLQYANLFPLLRDLSGLEARRTAHELRSLLAGELQESADAQDRRHRLNAFKDREMFRVDMRHILGKIEDFRHFSAELSDIAETVIGSATEFCFEELVARFGVPMTEAGTACRYVVSALGKTGGRELGFASDIELLFLYEADGRTKGKQSIPNSEFFARLVEAFTQSIQARQEGIFQIDLRLRPFGRGGNLATSWAAFENYFGPQGPAWPYERQRWSSCGLSPATGRSPGVAGACDRLTRPRRSRLSPSLSALRERQIRQLVQAGTFSRCSVRGDWSTSNTSLLQLTHGTPLGGALRILSFTADAILAPCLRPEFLLR